MAHKGPKDFSGAVEIGAMAPGPWAEPDDEYRLSLGSHVLQLFSTEPHAPDELLFNLMNDIGALIGKLLERERSTAEMADLVWREQQGLLHNLHDS